MARILPAVLLLGLHSVPARGGAPSPSTHAGDLTIIQTSIRARGARAERIRSRIARPRPLPAALRRSLTPGLVVVAAAGELEPGTFAVSVAILNRRAASASARVTRPGHDLEDRIARVATARLTGVRGAGKKISRARADDVLSSSP